MKKYDNILIGVGDVITISSEIKTGDKDNKVYDTRRLEIIEIRDRIVSKPANHIIVKDVSEEI